MKEELMLEIVPIDTPTLGDRSYVVHDGRVAFVVDPQRDIDRVLAVLEDRGVRLRDVFETHIHNDYVTGGLALARLTGAAYHVNAADEVSFERDPVEPGDMVSVGELRVRAVATPGHTFTHLAYVLEAPGEAPAVFTGGSLLFGSTGRPDLLGPAHTGELVHAQYASAHRLAAELPDDTRVFPTHGFGSFCSASQSEADSSTIEQEKRANPVLTQSEQQYVDSLLAGLDAYPAYYAHMGPANAAGPGPVDLDDAAAGRCCAAASPDRGGRVGGRPTYAHGLRRRARRRHAELRPGRQLRDLPGMAHPVGHTVDRARRERAGRRDGAAGTGPHRHRPAGGRHDRITAGLERR
ncbi:MAG TPA: MBL fold metallo-hydrolase [Amycolatopsis sp.]|nr:MBL fold metallo-hydrolase [Amycolatopsis sp.]